MENKRFKSIDRFRGILVFLMILFQALEHFPVLGWLTRLNDHSPSKDAIYLFNNLALVDLGAPMFLFVIALTYRNSLLKRIQVDGRKNAYMHFVTRYLSLIGIGTILWCIDEFFNIINERFITFNNVIRFILLCLSVVTLLLCMVWGISLFIKNKEFTNKISKYSMGGLSIIGIISAIFIVKLDVTYGFDKAVDFKCWGVLQSIGLAGLLSLLVMEKSTLTRLITSVSIFVFYVIIYQFNDIVRIIDLQVQGGLLGDFAWCATILFASVIADGFYKDESTESDKFVVKHKNMLLGLCVTTVIAIISAFFDISKGVVSPAYVSFSMCASNLAFFIVVLTENIDLKFDFFALWGKSAIIMYLLEYLFVNVFCFVVDVESFSLALAILYLVILMGGFTVLSYFINKNEKSIKL